MKKLLLTVGACAMLGACAHTASDPQERSDESPKPTTQAQDDGPAPAPARQSITKQTMPVEDNAPAPDAGPSFRHFDVASTPLAIRPNKPIKNDHLEFLAGFHLQSTQWNFGGFSALAVKDDGETLVALSDRAHWLNARLVYDDQGKLTGLDDAKITPLRGAGGRELANGWGDSESLVIDQSAAYISFEGQHRIDRYRLAPNGGPVFGASVHHFGSDAMPPNRGIEAMAKSDDGWFFCFERRRLCSRRR